MSAPQPKSPLSSTGGPLNQKPYILLRLAVPALHLPARSSAFYATSASQVTFMQGPSRRARTQGCSPLTPYRVLLTGVQNSARCGRLGYYVT